ncbi:hypothetical protein H9L01_02395 [Erysipelothrix inopinata]|uniref:YHYH domain-containing protein n=1 Tax=Erysipelothrix inopinata TaxID=225084 RepID=A0A7G9S061_9FIRM|nr:hypothetical protein [Erysipelothrix inopinata]QNN61236.1 hypothetical protein H9L01_02395 [Erysipelothrix inopinata]
MKNRKIKVSLLAMLMFITFGMSIEASGGQISSGNVVSCNGQLYGSHGPDNHWHRASKKGNRYYPDGDNLGYSNPCGGGSAPAPASNNSEQKRVAAEKSEAARVENERIAAEKAEAKRIEDERIEAERLEAEKLEAERLEKERLEEEQRAKEEKERLESVEIDNIKLETKTKGFVPLNLNQSNIYLAEQPFPTNIQVDLKNKDASYKVEMDKSENFKESKINVEVTSEDESKSKKYVYSIIYIDENMKFDDYKITVISSGENIELSPGGNFMKISNKDYKHIKKFNIQGLKVNDTSIGGKELEFNEEENIIEVTTLSGRFSIPLEVESSGSVAVGVAVTATGAAAGAFGVHTYLKKKRK